MGKIEYFSIVLQKQHPIYFCGESVFGNAILRVNERLKINSLKIQINGIGRVYW